MKLTITMEIAPSQYNAFARRFLDMLIAAVDDGDFTRLPQIKISRKQDAEVGGLTADDAQNRYDDLLDVLGVTESTPMDRILTMTRKAD